MLTTRTYESWGGNTIYAIALDNADEGIAFDIGIETVGTGEKRIMENVTFIE